MKQTNKNFSDSANNNVIKVNIKKNDSAISTADLYEARKIFADVYDTEIEATIAVVAYNRPDVTELCIESILKYTKDVNYKLLLIYNENENGKGILEYFKATPHKARMTTLYVINLHIFRHITQKFLDIRQYACEISMQSDEKSDCVSAAQSLCGVALKM